MNRYKKWEETEKEKREKQDQEKEKEAQVVEEAKPEVEQKINGDAFGGARPKIARPHNKLEVPMASVEVTYIDENSGESSGSKEDKEEVVDTKNKEEEKSKFFESWKNKYLKLKYLEKMEDFFMMVATRIVSFVFVKPVHQMYIYNETEDALETIDSISRKYFPTAFLLMMVIYWTTYLYIMPDEILVKFEAFEVLKTII